MGASWGSQCPEVHSWRALGPGPPSAPAGARPGALPAGIGLKEGLHPGCPVLRARGGGAASIAWWVVEVAQEGGPWALAGSRPEVRPCPCGVGAGRWRLCRLPWERPGSRYGAWCPLSRGSGCRGGQGAAPQGKCLSTGGWAPRGPRVLPCLEPALPGGALDSSRLPRTLSHPLCSCGPQPPKRLSGWLWDLGQPGLSLRAAPSWADQAGSGPSRLGAWACWIRGPERCGPRPLAGPAPSTPLVLVGGRAQRGAGFRGEAGVEAPRRLWLQGSKLLYFF